MIRAFAMRTASVLGDGFFGRDGGVSAPGVGSMRNCVGAIEPCWAGCTLIGPVRVDLFPGILDNAQLSSSFDGVGEKRVGRISKRVARTREPMRNPPRRAHRRRVTPCSFACGNTAYRSG
jgi:hypothetical protein